MIPSDDKFVEEYPKEIGYPPEILTIVERTTTPFLADTVTSKDTKGGQDISMNTLTIPYYKFWDIPAPTLKAGTKYAYVEALWCANDLQEIVVDSRIDSATNCFDVAKLLHLKQHTLLETM